MKTALKVMIMFAFVLTLGAFSAFAGPDSAEIAGDKDNWFDFPGAVYYQTDKHYTGTTRLHPFNGTRTSIVVEDGVIKTIYEPWYIQFDDSTFSGTNYIQLDGTAMTVGENIVNDSVFSGTNQIDNEGSYPLKSNPTNTVTSTTFEDNTTIDTYYQLAQAEGTSAIGTQISGSTFNDNTTLNVQSGGTLEITDSTINLADEGIMSQYFGLDNSNPDSLLQRIYYAFFSSVPMVRLAGSYTTDGSIRKFTDCPAPFYSYKLGGFVNWESLSFDIPAGFGFYNGVGSNNNNVYGPTDVNNRNVVENSNFAYFNLFTLGPFFKNLFHDIRSTDKPYFDSTIFLPQSNNVVFRSSLLFSVDQLIFSKVNEQPSFTSQQVYCTLPALIDIQMQNIATIFSGIFSIFADWYYPFSADIAHYYWYAWNTDTSSKEQTNIATVLYYITWYLGNMYQMNTWTAGEELQQPIDDLNDKFNDLDSAEDGIWNSISGSFDGFDPDPGSVSDLGAIGWCANYLQQIYVSLGAFNIPIMVGLLLGVCMQFIGYFKYKY